MAIYGNGISDISRPIVIANYDKLWQAQETSWIFFVDVLARPIHHYLARSRKPFWCFSANVSTMSAAVCAALCSTAG